MTEVVLLLQKPTLSGKEELSFYHTLKSSILELKHFPLPSHSSSDSENYEKPLMLYIPPNNTCKNSGNRTIATESKFTEGGFMYELQSIQPRKNSSFFVNQRINSSKEFYIANKIDPRFLLLPYFENSNGKFSPLDQIVVSK